MSSDVPQLVQHPTSCYQAGASACVMVCDVSDFVKVANTYITQHGPKSGAEQTKLWLDQIFGHVLPAIHAHHGEVLQFIGDAVVACFSPEQAASALDCAVHIHLACTHIQSSEGASQIKIGLGHGLCEVVGTTNHTQTPLQAVLGQAFEQALHALRFAGKHDIVVAPSLLQLAGEAVHQWQHSPAGDDFRRIHATAPHPMAKLAGAQTEPHPPLQHDNTNSSNEIKLLTVLYLEVMATRENSKLGAAHLKHINNALHHAIKHHKATLTGLCETPNGLRFQYLLGSQTSKTNPTEQAIELATQAQQAVHKAVPASQSRVSIGYGHAWQGQHGNSSTPFFSVHGREINLAARILEKTEPGSVRLTENASQQLSDTLHVVDMGLLALKGEEQAVRSYRVPARHELRLQQASNPLHGRAAELQQALNLIGIARNRQKPCVIELLGPAGVGKSTFVGGLQKILLASQYKTVELRASPHTRLLPYAAAYPLIIELARCDGSDKPGEWLRGMVDENQPLYPWLGLIGLVTPLQLHVSDEASKASPDNRARKLLEIMALLVQQLAVRHRLVFVIEDLQWFDKASIQLLAEVLFKQPGCACVYTARTEDEDSKTAELQQQLQRFSLRPHTISLGPFTLAETAHYLSRYFNVQAVPGHLIRVLQELSGGNLLLINALIQRMLQDQLIQTSTPGQLDINYDRLEQLSSIPTNLEQALQARIDLQAPLHRQVLCHCAIFKTAFTLDDVQQAFGYNSRDTLERIFQQLLEDKLIKPAPSISGQENFVFEHQVIEQCAYDRVPFEERKKMHARVAQWIESRIGTTQSGATARLTIRLAAQYTWAGMLNKAVPLTKTAIEHAFEVGALEEALERLNSLLEWRTKQLLPAQSALEVARWHERKAQVFFAQGNFVKAVDSSKAALDHLGFPHPDGEKYSDTQVVRELRRLHALQESNRSEAIAKLADSTEGKLATHLYANLGELYFYLGMGTSSYLYLLKGVELALHAQEASGEVVKAFVGSTIVCQIFGRKSWVPRFRQLAFNTVERIEDHAQRAKATAFLCHRMGYVEYAEGQLEHSMATNWGAVESARQSQEYHIEMLAYGSLIVTRVAQGKFEEALKLYPSYEALTIKYAGGYFNVFHQYGLMNQKIYCLAALNRLDEAKAELAVLEKLAEELKFTKVSALPVQRCKLMVLKQSGDLPAAIEQAMLLGKVLTDDIESKAYLFTCVSLPLEVLLDAQHRQGLTKAEQHHMISHLIEKLHKVQQRYDVAKPAYLVLRAQLELNSGNPMMLAEKLLKQAIKLADKNGQLVEAKRARALRQQYFGADAHQTQSISG